MRALAREEAQQSQKLAIARDARKDAAQVHSYNHVCVYVLREAFCFCPFLF